MSATSCPHTRAAASPRSNSYGVTRRRRESNRSHLAYRDVPSIIAFLFLFNLLQPEEPPHLRVDLVFVGSIQPMVQATAIHEARLIWSPYNVDLHLSTADAAPDGVLRIAVIIASQAEGKLPVSTLGSIRFREGVPEPTILMYAKAIDTLVEQVPLLRLERQSLPAVHDLMVGRAFGRALAHE